MKATLWFLAILNFLAGVFNMFWFFNTGHTISLIAGVAGGIATGVCVSTALEVV